MAPKLAGLAPGLRPKGWLFTVDWVISIRVYGYRSLTVNPGTLNLSNHNYWTTEPTETTETIFWWVIRFHFPSDLCGYQSQAEQLPRQYLSLSLLMPGIRANNPYDTFSFHDLAFVTTGLNWSMHFHRIILPQHPGCGLFETIGNTSSREVVRREFH